MCLHWLLASVDGNPVRVNRPIFKNDDLPPSIPASPALDQQRSYYTGLGLQGGYIRSWAGRIKDHLTTVQILWGCPGLTDIH